MKFSLLKLFLIVTIFATVICYGSYRHRGFAQQVDKVLTRAGHGKDGGNYHIQVYGNDIRPAALVFIDHHVDPSRPGKFPAIDFASTTPPALPRLVVAGEPVNLANGIAIVYRSTTGYAETIRIRSSKQDELIADFSRSAISTKLESLISRRNGTSSGSKIHRTIIAIHDVLTPLPLGAEVVRDEPPLLGNQPHD